MPVFDEKTTTSQGYDPRGFPLVTHMNYDTFDLFDAAIDQLKARLEDARKARLELLVEFMDCSATVIGFEKHLEELEGIFGPEKIKVNKARELEEKFADKNKKLLQDIKDAGYQGDPMGFYDQAKDFLNTKE